MFAMKGRKVTVGSMTASPAHLPAQHDHGQQHQHDQPAVERRCDVAVIGGSAAGLAGALQLARQRRGVIVVDDGTPRNAPAEQMHGYLGREGVAPSELVSIGREEVRSYGGEVLAGRVRSVARRDDGLFQVEVPGGHRLLARRVLAATGLVDELPQIEGLAEHWGHGVVHCPFCHGYEVRERRLVQIVTQPLGLHPTALFHHLSERLTVVLHGAIEDEQVLALEAAGVAVVRSEVRRLVTAADQTLAGVELVSGEVLDADAVIVGGRFRARADVLAGVGVSAVAHSSGAGDIVEVDPMTGQTSTPGVYAAGNLTDPSLQVLSAAAHGSRVGAMISFSLAEEDLRTATRPSAEETDWDHRYGGEDPIWSANPNGTLLAEVSGLTPGRALDVGAGEGADALWLSRQGWQVTASDISGRALARVAEEAARRGLHVDCLRVDAATAYAFGEQTYDLVSLQYGSIHRSPDRTGLRNLLAAVAPGGTLLVVGHDQARQREPVEVTTQTRVFDPDAYVDVEQIAAALRGADGWQVEVHQTRPRPPGAISTHHVDDVVLRARRSR